MSAPTDSGRATQFIQGWLLPLLVLAWTSAVMASYYFVHKPIGLEHASTLARSALAVLGWLGSVVAAHLVGRILLRRISGVESGDRWALSIGLGYAAWSVFFLLLGGLRAYSPAVAWAIVIVAVPLGVGPFARDLRSSAFRLPQRARDRALMVFTATILGLAFFRALAAPTAWDSLVYHLTGPKLYIEANRLVQDVDLPYLGFPQGGSMLFLWGLLLAGPQTAQLMHWGFALLTLILLKNAAGRLSPGMDWLVVAILVAVPTAALLAGWAYVEWIAMYAGLASFLMIPRDSWAENGSGDPRPSVRRESGPEPGTVGSDSSRLLISGAFAGMSLAAKYSTVGLVIALALVVLWSPRARRGFWVWGAGLGAVVLPFLLKNFILTGNPVYPFFLPGRFWDAHRGFWYSRSGTGLNWQSLLLAPWDATVWGLEGKVVEGHPPYSATVGPLLLALLPLMALGGRARATAERWYLRSIVLVAVPSYVFWVGQLAFSVLLVQTRLLFPALPFLALLAGEGFHRLSSLPRPRFSPGFVVGGLIGLHMVLAVLESTVSLVSQSVPEELLGVRSESDYLRSNLGQYYLAMESLAGLPPGSVVRFLWEPRGYYCPSRIRCEADSLLDRWWHTRQHEQDPDSISDSWQQEGVTHVLIFHLGAEVIREAEFDPLSVSDWDSLAAWLRHDLEAVHAVGDYGLYRWRAESEP